MRSPFIIHFYRATKFLGILYGFSGKYISQALLNYYTGREFNKKYLKFLNLTDIIELNLYTDVIKASVKYGKPRLETILCIDNLIRFPLLPVNEREVKITSTLGYDIIVGRIVVKDDIEIVQTKSTIGRASVNS